MNHCLFSFVIDLKTFRSIQKSNIKVKRSIAINQILTNEFTNTFLCTFWFSIWDADLELATSYGACALCMLRKGGIFYMLSKYMGIMYMNYELRRCITDSQSIAHSNSNPKILLCSCKGISCSTPTLSKQGFHVHIIIYQTLCVYSCFSAVLNNKCAQDQFSQRNKICDYTVTCQIEHLGTMNTCKLNALSSLEYLTKE